MDTFLKDSANFFEQIKSKFHQTIFTNDQNSFASSTSSTIVDAMDPEEFRKYGKQMVDYVADYWATIRSRKPLHNVKPGYIWKVLPDHAPEDPEEWSSIFKDLENVIMDGVINIVHLLLFLIFGALHIILLFLDYSLATSTLFRILSSGE